MTFQIKICGLRDPDIAAQAVADGATMIGLVFFEKSPRHVNPADAAYVADAVRGLADIVGLFVNPDMTRLADTLAEVPLTHIQLHGTETPERVRAISEAFGWPVIKAIGVATRQDVEAAEAAYSEDADMLLFDAKPPKLATHPGGNGVRFDPQILAGVKGAVPWMISGGLTPDNVFDTVDAVHALPGFSGVDVSSGVEREPGYKDIGKIADFIATAKGAASDLMDRDA